MKIRKFYDPKVLWPSPTKKVEEKVKEENLTEEIVKTPIITAQHKEESGSINCSCSSKLDNRLIITLAIVTIALLITVIALLITTIQVTKLMSKISH